MYNLDQFTHKLTWLLFVCEWIGPGYTWINSGKNAFNPIIIYHKFECVKIVIKTDYNTE